MKNAASKEPGGARGHPDVTEKVWVVETEQKRNQ